MTCFREMIEWPFMKVLQKYRWLPVHELMIKSGGSKEGLRWWAVGWKEQQRYNTLFMVAREREALGGSFIDKEMSAEMTEMLGERVYFGLTTSLDHDMLRAVIKLDRKNVRLSAILPGRHDIDIEFSCDGKNVVVTYFPWEQWANVYPVGKGAKKLAEVVAETLELEGIGARVTRNKKLVWRRNQKALYA